MIENKLKSRYKFYMCSKFFAMTDEKGLFHKKSQEIDVIHGELQLLHVKS